MRGKRASQNIQSENVRQSSSELMRAYEVRPPKDKRGVDLISGALPFGRLWYVEPNAISNAVGYAKFYSRSHDTVIRVFDFNGQRDRNARARVRGGYSP
jgi:hypothetical protein